MLGNVENQEEAKWKADAATKRNNNEEEIVLYYKHNVSVKPRKQM